MRGKAALLGMALLAGAVSGCGESTPKRAVDARTEVLGFYAADAPVVAVLRPVPTEEVVALNRTAAGYPAWEAMRAMLLGPLHAAGLGRARLARLVEPREEIEDIAASAAALGAPTPADLGAGRPLLVLATDQDDLLARLMAGAAHRGELRRAGTLDEATLYRNRSFAYAVRDGVLISAGSLAEVRRAIERRDGDSDQRLDEDVVHSVFNDFDPQGPLLVYANVPQLSGKADVAPYVPDRAVLESADDAAASVHAAGDSLAVDVVVRLEHELAPAEVSLSEAPRPVALQIPGIGSLSGVGSGSGDEVRLHLGSAEGP